MTAPSKKLAESLSVLKALQDQGQVAIRGSELTRTHRERLLKSGCIGGVMKGWYVPSRPDEPAGESTSWYASFWGFCTAYLNERFGSGWCLSPERLDLPLTQDMEVKDGVRIFNLSAALIACSPSHFTARPVEMRAALAMVQDASDVLSRLLAGGHSTITGRLAGAMRNIGREQVADNIVKTMQAAGYTVNESDPFDDASLITFSARETSPYVNRMRMNWARMRTDVLKVFPPTPGLAKNMASYMKQVDEVYVSDAYNSLSIEGYKVSTDLIERVRSGN